MQPAACCHAPTWVCYVISQSAFHTHIHTAKLLVDQEISSLFAHVLFALCIRCSSSYFPSFSHTNYVILRCSNSSASTFAACHRCNKSCARKIVLPRLQPKANIFSQCRNALPLGNCCCDCCSFCCCCCCDCM